MLRRFVGWFFAPKYRVRGDEGRGVWLVTDARGRAAPEPFLEGLIVDVHPYPAGGVTCREVCIGPSAVLSLEIVWRVEVVYRGGIFRERDDPNSVLGAADYLLLLPGRTAIAGWRDPPPLRPRVLL